MRHSIHILALICAPLLGLSLVGVADAVKKPKPLTPEQQETGEAEAKNRGLLIVVAADAPPAVRECAQTVMRSISTSPLLRLLAGDHPPAQLTDSAELMKGKIAARAFNHLVIVGLPGDPTVLAAWQRQAKLITEPAPGFYLFGFGTLTGDIGYVESDRNPFLHSAEVDRAPDETEIVTLTGSTPAGVRLAVDAFLHEGLINGVVAAPGWRRPMTSLLDRDPIAPGFTLPDVISPKSDGGVCIGVTMAGEDEYRGVLQDTGVEPQLIWRAKYYTPGAWDKAGYENSLQEFNDGLNRRAYGDTLWSARFSSPTEASEAATKIAAAANLRKDKASGAYAGKQPPLGPEKTSAGTITLTVKSQWVLMRTLSAASTASIDSEK